MQFHVSESRSGNAQAFGNFLNVLLFVHEQGNNIFSRSLKSIYCLDFVCPIYPQCKEHTHTHTEADDLNSQANYTALQPNQHPLHVFELRLQITISSWNLTFPDFAQFYALPNICRIQTFNPFISTHSLTHSDVYFIHSFSPFITHSLHVVLG